MYEKEEIISDYIKEELSDVPNILNNEFDYTKLSKVEKIYIPLKY